MAIEVGGTAVVDDNRGGTFTKVQLGVYATGSLPSGAEGDMVYDSDAAKIKVYDGSAWV